MIYRFSTEHQWLNYSKVGGGTQHSFPPFPSLPFLNPLPSFSLSLKSPSDVGRPFQLGVLGERCNLPLRGLGRSPSRNSIWCI